MRRNVTGLVLLGAVLLAGRVSAQGLIGPFASRGKVALSAERFFGYSHTSQTTSLGGAESTQGSDNIAVLGNPLGAVDTGYSWPRLALDGLLPIGVTIGGTASVFSLSVKPQGASTSTDVIKGFHLGGRVGFGYMFTPTMGIWPRAGVTYVSASNDQTSTSYYALTLDAPLLFGLSAHAGISVTPTLDLGLGGSSKNKMLNTSVDRKMTDAGLQLGVVVFL